MRSSLRDNPLLHPLFAPILLIAAVVAAYYPAIGSGIHTMDDPGLITLYTTPPPLLELLTPGRGGYYYRPVVEFTYYLDSRLWSLEPAVLHLENVLLHLANALLVYLLAQKATKRFPLQLPWIPLGAALLFALHPLNVEAVAWISGRTDLIASVFVLGAACCFLDWLEEGRRLAAIGTVILLGLGVLSKETAIAFLPVLLLLWYGWPSAPAHRKRVALVFAALSFLVFLVALLLMSKGGLPSLKRFLAPERIDLLGWLRNSATAFGFYVKKLVLPLPLNFAIAEVDSRYALLGALALVLLLVAWFFWRSNALFFAAAAVMLLPALLVASKHIAWTSYAERYMYLPTAFCSVGVACLLLSARERARILLGMLLAGALCLAAVAVFQRTTLWGDKLAFYRDAVHKSPGFGSVHYELGSQLALKGDYDAAAQAFATADRLNQRPSMKLPIKCNIMSTMMARHQPAEARAYFYRLFPDKRDAPADFLQLLCTLDSSRLTALPQAEQRALADELLQTLALLNEKKPDPFWLYRSGQIAAAVGRTREAAAFYGRAYAGAPADAYYKAAAKAAQMRMEAAR